MRRIILTALLFGSLCGNAEAFLVGYSRGVAGPDVTDPELSTATANGTDRTLVFTEAVTANTTGELCSDWELTWTTAGADSSWTYVSGDGTATVHCTGVDVGYGDTVSAGLDYTPGTIVDLAGTPNALAAITSAAVTNNTPAPPSYILTEDFATCTNWTLTETDGTGTCNYTTETIGGTSQGYFLTSGTSDALGATIDITMPSDKTQFGLYTIVQLDDAGASSFGSYTVQFRRSGGAVLGYALILATEQVRIAHGSVTSDTFTMSAGTTYHLWFYWTKSTGTDGILKMYVDTDADKSGGTEYTITTGTSAYDVDVIRLQASYDRDLIFAKFRVDNVEIGANP